MPLAGVLEGFDRHGSKFLDFRLSTKRESYFVGRQSDAVDIVLEHESISRRHAELTITPVGVTLSDLASAHGTFVDGRRLKPNAPAPLGDGTRITFAGSSRRFRFRTPAAVAAEELAAGGAAADDAGAPALFPTGPVNEPLCKAVLYILRHSLSDGPGGGFRLRPDGFVPMDELCKASALSTYHCGADDLDALARATAARGLFECRHEGARQLIRAKAGHAAEVRVSTALQLTSLSLRELGELELAHHGTYFAAWNAIRAHGLDAMAPPSRRGVVCFSDAPPPKGATPAGMRAPPEVLVSVDAQLCAEHGLRWFRDERGALCCAGAVEDGRIPLHYATRVINLRNGRELMDAEELQAARERASGGGAGAQLPAAAARGAAAAERAPSAPVGPALPPAPSEAPQRTEPAVVNRPNPYLPEPPRRGADDELDEQSEEEDEEEGRGIGAAGGYAARRAPRGHAHKRLRLD